MDEHQNFIEYLNKNQEQIEKLTELISHSTMASEDFYRFRDHAFYSAMNQLNQINKRLTETETTAHSNFLNTKQYTFLKWCAIINSLISLIILLNVFFL